MEKPQPAEPLSMSKIEDELERLIVEQDEDNQKIFNWIMVSTGFCHF